MWHLDMMNKLLKLAQTLQQKYRLDLDDFTSDKVSQAPCDDNDADMEDNEEDKKTPSVKKK